MTTELATVFRFAVAEQNSHFLDGIELRFNDLQDRGLAKNQDNSGSDLSGTRNLTLGFKYHFHKAGIWFIVLLLMHWYYVNTI